MEENKKGFYHVSELIPSLFAELSGKKQAIPEKGFMRYGLASLDQFTGGLHSRDLVLLMGGGDFERYALCGKIIRNLAMMRKKPVLVLPFDLPSDEFVKMLVCQIADIHGSLITAAKISIHDLGNTVMSTLNKIKISNIYCLTESSHDSKNVCEEIISFANSYSHSVIAFLGLPLRKTSEDQPGWRSAFEDLKTRISKDCAILVCIGDEHKEDITQVSNVIFKLADDKKPSEKSFLEIKIIRNMHGPTGNVRFMFKPQSGGVEECGAFFKERPVRNSFEDKTATC